MKRLLAGGLLAFCTGLGHAQFQIPVQAQDPYVGQAGKDVIWVPTPPELVERMLDMAGVTASDYVIDLGSGDGRNVIAAAKRGARALGVEYDANLVFVSRRNAAKPRISIPARVKRAASRISGGQ